MTDPLLKQQKGIVKQITYNSPKAHVHTLFHKLRTVHGIYDLELLRMCTIFIMRIRMLYLDRYDIAAIVGGQKHM